MTDKIQQDRAGGGNHCPQCGAATELTDRFCRSCGTSLTSDPTRRTLGGPSGLRALGLGVIALAGLFAVFYYGSGGFQDREPSPQSIPISGVGAGGGAGSSEPLSARQSADLLFNRAMSAYEMGDSAEAGRFIPMALAAYRELEALDLDAHYHIALLSLAANLPGEALAQADTMLAESPDHLLALSAAGEAHAALGNEEQAAQYFRRFLELDTPEIAASRPEYLDHARALPARREEAREYLQQRGLPVE